MRLQEAQRLRVEWDPSIISAESVDAGARKLLAKEGYDPQFGARPLKRAVEKRILNPLSMKLPEGDLSRLGNGERNLSRFARRKPARAGRAGTGESVQTRR